MNNNDFLEKIEQSGIARHKEYLRQVVRPAIDIVKNNDVEPRLGCSRFGGAPDLPAAEANGLHMRAIHIDSWAKSILRKSH